MENNESTKCFDGSMAVEDVQKKLEKICSNVKYKKNKFYVKHENTNFILFRNVDGYYAAIKPSIGAIVSMILFCLLVLFVILYVYEFVLGWLPSLLLALGLKLIYYASKKGDLRRFCEEARNSA